MKQVTKSKWIPASKMKGMTTTRAMKVEQTRLAEKLQDYIAMWKASQAEVERLEAERDDLAQRMRMLVARNTRLTQLLRASLPEDAQVGNGLEGMIESLLARMVRLRGEGEK